MSIRRAVHLLAIRTCHFPQLDNRIVVRHAADGRSPLPVQQVVGFRPVHLQISWFDPIQEDPTGILVPFVFQQHRITLFSNVQVSPVGPDPGKPATPDGSPQCGDRQSPN